MFIEKCVENTWAWRPWSHTLKENLSSPTSDNHTRYIMHAFNQGTKMTMGLHGWCEYRVKGWLTALWFMHCWMDPHKSMVVLWVTTLTGMQTQNTVSVTWQGCCETTSHPILEPLRFAIYLDRVEWAGMYSWLQTHFLAWLRSFAKTTQPSPGARITTFTADTDLQKVWLSSHMQRVASSVCDKAHRCCCLTAGVELALGSHPTDSRNWKNPFFWRKNRVRCQSPARWSQAYTWAMPRERGQRGFLPSTQLDSGFRTQICLFYYTVALP